MLFFNDGQTHRKVVLGIINFDFFVAEQGVTFHNVFKSQACTRHSRQQGRLGVAHHDVAVRQRNGNIQRMLQ